MNRPAKHIPFSPPDITQAEIDEVVDALRSGWITTGPKTKRFEAELAAFTGAAKVACLSSATAALECGLRLLGIGPGDEVITTAYTYTASCSCICHVGATPVLCDTASGSYEMDYAALADLVTARTRAVIPVDLGGVMCDYDALFAALGQAAGAGAWRPANEREEALGRPAVLADGAHALGAVRFGVSAGSIADLTAFSFHAVKNLTTAEGGALGWKAGLFADDEAAYHQVMLMALHGQSKDALAKTRAGAWEYDIAFPGWKCNMTDIQASLGLAQLHRYPGLLARRRALVARYERALAGSGVELVRHYRDADGGSAADADDAAARADARCCSSSGHLMLARLSGHGQAFRNRVIEVLAEDFGVAANVHYQPLPMLSAYRDLGFDIDRFPHAFAQFENEITLPLHTLLSDEDVDYVAASLIQACEQAEREGVR